MDPNKTLENIRAYYSAILNGEEGEETALAEAIEALDNWLSKGGFLPKAWKK